MPTVGARVGAEPNTLAIATPAVLVPLASRTKKNCVLDVPLRAGHWRHNDHHDGSCHDGLMKGETSISHGHAGRLSNVDAIIAMFRAANMPAL